MGTNSIYNSIYNSMRNNKKTKQGNIIMRISNGKKSYINLEEQEYNKLLDRFDNALIEKELLNDEIKELKQELDYKNKALQQELINKDKLVKDNAEYIKIHNQQKSNIKNLKKFNGYYISQIKAIRTIAQKCEGATKYVKIFDINNILSICNDMGIDYNNINYKYVNINDFNITLLDCAYEVIELVNKYHYLVDDDGVGNDNDYFVEDVKRIIAKHINLSDKGVNNAK